MPKRNHYYIEMADEDVTANDVVLQPIKNEPQCHNYIESEICENSEKVPTYDCTSEANVIKPNYEQAIERHLYDKKPSSPSRKSPGDSHLNRQRCPIKVEEADNFTISEIDDVSESKSDVSLTDSEMNVNQEAIKKPDENGAPSNKQGENLHSNCSSFNTEPSSGVVETKKGSKKSIKFQCSICSDTLSSSKYLRYHIARKHTGDLPFSCEQCPQKCVLAYELKRHVLVKHSKRVFRCGVCSYECALPHALKNHMLNQHNGMTYIMATSRPSVKTEPRSKIIETKKQSEKSVKFQCSICSDTLSTSRRLKDHIARRHTLDLPFSCEQCPHKSISLSELKCHVLAKHTEPLYKCGVCSYKTSLPRRLKSHMLTRLHGMTASDRQYKCSICDCTLPNSTLLKHHIARKHTDDLPFSCEQCPRKCISSHELKSHVLAVHTERIYKFNCSVCSYKSVSSHGLKAHMLSRLHGLTASDRPYKCSECTYTCVEHARLQDHILSVHRGEHHQCPQCVFKSKTRDGLKSHIQLKHTAKSILCEDCGYACSCPVALKRHIYGVHQKDNMCPICGLMGYKGRIDTHIRTHTGERPYQCTQCDANFANAYNLKCHLSKHTTERLFACKLCNYKGKADYQLYQHIRNVHKVGKMFTCEYCPFTSKAKQTVKNHVMSKHTREHPFKCGDCDYTSVLKPALTHHILSKHTKERPFKCSECKFETTTALQLKQHTLGQHSTERNFTCSQCDYKTYAVAFLNQHIKKKHG